MLVWVVALYFGLALAIGQRNRAIYPLTDSAGGPTGPPFFIGDVFIGDAIQANVPAQTRERRISRCFDLSKLQVSKFLQTPVGAGSRGPIQGIVTSADVMV